MNKLSILLKKFNINFSFLKMISPSSLNEVSKIMDPPKTVRKMTEWKPGKLNTQQYVIQQKWLVNQIDYSRQSK